MMSLIPITRPWRSASAPPELPGLMAASVWIIGWVSPAGEVTARSTALRYPTVTVPSSPNGLPMAMASWPTRNSSSTASSAACMSTSPGSKPTTATSEAVSAPTTSPSSRVPSESRTVTCSAFSTTCAAVRMSPLSS